MKIRVGQQKQNNYQMPEGIDSETAEWLKKDVFPLGPYRDESLTGTTELRHLRWFYESAPECRGEEFFPRLDGMPPRKWRKLQRLVPLVNLLRPCVTTFVAAVFNGNTVRKLLQNPYTQLLESYIAGPEYDSAVTKWAAHAMLYGVALAVPQVADDGTISVYLPDPCGTYIWTDPLDIRRIVKVAEVTDVSVRYFTLAGFGILTKKFQEHVPCDYGEYLPVAYAAGEDCRATGRIYSVSLCRDALHWSIAVGDALFKARQLQAKETTSKLVITGVDDLQVASTPNPQLEQQTEPREERDTIKLPPGADAKFIKPPLEMQSSIDLARACIGQLATAISIPADALDANYSMTGSGGSAEAARIRAIPLLNKSKFLQKQWAQYESDLVFAITAQVEYTKGSRALTLKDLRSRIETKVTYDPFILPQSPNEVAATTISLMGAGLISPEDAIRRVTNNATPEQVQAQTAQVLDIRKQAGGAPAATDGVFKTTPPAKPA